MADELLDNLSKSQAGQQVGGFAIAPGIVTNNIDLIGEGRVQVKISSRPAFEPWARIHALGGSASRGFLWIPQMGDEVLVAFAEDDLSSAYVLGGLWSTMNHPPASAPNDFLTKKIIKTGLTDVLGHQIELDDALQSIIITTSTDQKITLDPTKIELTNLAGSVMVQLDNEKQSVTISAVNKIELNAAISIELNAAKIDMSAAEVSITSTGPCSVVGLPIKLN
jgi:uncharacterized protein involved in type VI secretion and phage assembly